METEIKERIAAASRCLFGVQRIMKRRSISIRTKLKIYDTIIKPVLLYGCEAWSLTKELERNLFVFENRVLRRILGTVFDVENNEWRRRHNEELRLRTGQLNIVDIVNSRRLKYAGHVARMNDERIPKRVMEDKLVEGRRFPGRPRRRWIDNIKRDSGDDWMSLAQDRQQWRQLVLSARGHGGS